MKIFSEESNLASVAALVGRCWAGWWMSGRSSLWKMNKLKFVIKMRNITEENICAADARKQTMAKWNMFQVKKGYESILTWLLPDDWFDVSWLIGTEACAWSKEDENIFTTCATLMKNLSCEMLTWLPCMAWRRCRVRCRVLSIAGGASHSGNSSTWGNRDW